MTERISKICGNTVGSMDCELSLNSILIREDNSRITRPVMSRYNDYREGIKKLTGAGLDKSFLKRILRIWRNDQLAELERLRGKLPADAYTHLRCCMVANYRQAIAK